MIETVLNVLVAIAILAVSALLTHLFARAMYITCPKCHTLNARRRSQCRKCSQPLKR